MRKILIMELWAIGDVVMMSAVLGPLRRAYPNAEITVLCQAHGREALQENKEISSFVTFKFPWTVFNGKYRFWNWDWKGLITTIALLRKEKFDLIIDGRGDIRDDMLSFLIGGNRYISAPHQRSSHRVDCWAALLKEIGIPVDDALPSVAVLSQEKIAAEEFIKDHFAVRPRKLIGIHPGASHSVKRWPLKRFRELTERSIKAGLTGIVLFSDKEGHGKELGQGLNLPVFSGSIRELTALIGEMDLFLCNDTGVMHIASALKVPVVALFGPGDPKIFSPRGDVDILIKPCGHRPCYGKCGKVVADCLLDISVEDVWGVVSEKMVG